MLYSDRSGSSIIGCPVIGTYEFYDEDDDLLPNQISFRKLLKNLQGRYIADEHLKRQWGSTYANSNDLIDDIDSRKNWYHRIFLKNSDGECELIDMCSNVISRKSYYVLTIQFKIRFNS